MGINLNEISGLAGGGVEGFSKGSADRISRNQENRAQTQEAERRGQYEITEALKGKMAELAGLMDPSQQAQAGYIPPAGAQAGAPPQAIPAEGGGQPGGPPASPPPAGAMQAGPPPGAPPPQAQGALPAEAPQGGDKGMALDTMEVPGEADTTGPRDRLQQWKTEAMALAGRAGGVQAMDAVEQYYQMATQGQMYQYATEGIRALADGSAGNAAKMLNTAMEIAPVDPEIEFFAMNGELYGQRGDSEPRRYKQEDLIGLTESYLMDPENYLEWQKQMLEERKVGVSERNVAATEKQVDVYASEQTSRELLRKAQAYASLASGKAALSRAEAQGGEEGLAWNENNILKIEEIEQDAMDGKLGFGGAWMSEAGKNTELMNAAIGAAKEIRVANPPGSLTHNDASELARMAYFHQLPEDSGMEAPPNLGSTRVFTDGQGNYMVDYKGKKVLVPAIVGQNILSNKQFATE